MKVSFCKSIEVESTVDIHVDDITLAIEEAFDDAVQTSECQSANDRQKRFVINHFVTAVLQCLKATSAPMIAATTADVRIRIAERLRTEATRWDPQPAECPAEQQAKYDLVRTALVAMIGTDDPTELREIAADVKTSEGESAKTRDIVMATHALIATHRVLN